MQKTWTDERKNLFPSITYESSRSLHVFHLFPLPKIQKKKLFCAIISMGISWSNFFTHPHPAFLRTVTRYSSTKAEFKGQSADTSEVSLGGGWFPHGALEMLARLECWLAEGFWADLPNVGFLVVRRVFFGGCKSWLKNFQGMFFFFFLCGASDSPANLFLVNRDWHQERLLKKLQREILMNPVGFPKPAPLETRWRGFSARGERFVNSH